MGTEPLCEDARELAAKLHNEGNIAELTVWQAMPHAWQCFAPFLPEARASLAMASAFIRERRARDNRPAPAPIPPSA